MFYISNMMATNATDATDDINSNHDIDTEHESSVSGFSRARALRRKLVHVVIWRKKLKFFKIY